jgi:nitrile hydratase
MNAPDNDTHGYYRRMQAAVEELLILKGVMTAEEVQREVEIMEARTYERGARMVARAWVDPAYKQRMLANGKAGATELQIEVGPMHLIVLENTPRVHNVVVCTLCSCYPRFLLGIPPVWYKSKEYRSRVVREPRKVLEEFGTHLPAETEIRVHDSSADMRYMIMPLRPAGTEALDESALAAMITRDGLVGTAVL